MDGFYIGRYEVGKDTVEDNIVPVEMQYKEVYNYTNFYEAYDICKMLSGINESVESCLIYGCLWDATMEYLVKTENKTYYEIAVNSSGWGNYTDSTFEYTTILGNEVVKRKDNATIIPTGSTEYTNSCNIYDLAGNIWERTQEGDSNNYRYECGGHYNSTGTELPCGTHYIYRNVTFNYNNDGCRAILYVK